MKRSDSQLPNTFVSIFERVILLSSLPILMLVIANGEMGNDEGLWGYIGRVWVENGIPPYRGTVENKTPGIFLIYATAHALWGFKVEVLRVIGIAAIFITGWLIYLIGRLLCDRRAGVLCMLIFNLSMGWTLTDGPYTAQTETFMVLFSTLAFYIFFRFVSRSHGALSLTASVSPSMAASGASRTIFWLVVSGLAMGASIAFKQIAITTAGALLLCYLWSAIHNNSSASTPAMMVKGALIFIAGMLAATFISVIPLLISGVSIGEYVDGAWLILANAGSSPVRLLSRVNRMIQVFMNSKMMVFYPFIVFFLLGNFREKKPAVVCLMIWLACDFAGVNASGYYYGHQLKQLLPILSLMSGIALSQFASLLAERGRPVYLSGYIIPLALLLIFFPYDSCSLNCYRMIHGFQDRKVELGDWLNDQTAERDFIYVNGGMCDVVTARSRRVSSSRYFNDIFVTNDAARKERLTDLRENPPLYYLRQLELSREDAELDAFIADNYQLLKSEHGFDIHRRRQAIIGE